MPYLVLCDTAMTDTCALHLSFIVESHHTPAQLLSRVPPAKAGSSAQQIMAYDQSQCRGIIYQSNAPLSNAGLKVLELAERSRDQQYHDSTEADSGPLSMPSESSRSPRRGSGAHSIPNITTTAKRRRSTQIGVLEQGGIGPDLDRARSRIEGNTLQDAGPSSNDLWSAALRLLVLSREVPPQSSTKLPAPSFATGATKAKAPIIKTLTIPGVSKPKTLKPLTPLIVEKDPNQPSNPWNTGFRKKSDSIPPTPKVIPPTPLTPKTKIEKNRPPRIEKIYRTRLPCGFSEHAWAKILGYTVDAESILSFDQQLSILHYAIDRSTLSREREALGLTVATQIWRILEATGCLTYEMDI